ncbi:dicarboxylate carrier UCP2-like [Styela clava]
MKTSPDEVGLPLPLKIAAAGLAGCTADLATFPLDTIKVWLQVKGEGGDKTSSSKPLAAKHSTVPKGKIGLPVQTSHFSHTLASNYPNTARPFPGAKSTFQASTLPKGLHLTTPGSASATYTFTELTSSELYMLKKLSMSKQGGNGSAATTLLDNAVCSAIKVKANATQTFNELTLSEIYMAKKRAFAAVNPSKSAKGAMQTIISNVKKSGARSLYSGLSAGLQRQIGFCSVRIGFYDNVKNFYVNLLPGGPDSKLIGQRILAGATTGFMAVCMFQPTEVVKIRMQAEKGRYTSSLQAYRSLYKTGGIAEAWKGIGANCTRTAVVNVCELVTYDLIKETILKRNLMTDSLPCHFTSALTSGFITTVVASPVDVVKTRYMNSDKGTYKNPIQCAAKMFKSEGLRAFYKGFVPSYLRLGSWNIVMFVSYEQYKRIFKDVADSTPEFPAPHLGTSAPLLTPTEAVVEPVYPSYVEAMFHAQHESGPIS